MRAVWNGQLILSCCHESVLDDMEEHMSSSQCTTALVLTGGGARAAYQAGALKALAEKSGGECRFPIITGVSAGAINATYLASVTEKPIESAERLCEAWSDLQIEEVFRSDLSAIGRSLALWTWMLVRGGGAHTVPVRGIVDTAPLRNYLQKRVRVESIQSNLRQGDLEGLAISATNYQTGQTITFVQTEETFRPWVRAGRRSRQTQITVDHVMASSALPIVFPAVAVNGVYYGDGSVRQTAPLAPSIHMGADRILAISVRYPRTPTEEAEAQVQGYPPPAQILGMLMNSVFLDSLETDAERLRRTNQIIDHYSASRQPSGRFRHIDLMVLHPSKDLGKLSADLSADLPISLRLLVRGLGAERSRTPDFLSYLLFEPSYVNRLIELGYEDTVKCWPRIENFLSR